MKTAEIYTETESMTVDLSNTESLIKAMEFKSRNIKAKADPEIFAAAADRLRILNALEQTLNACHKLRTEV